MKDLSELKLPGDLRYAEDHEYARSVGKTFRVGISDYAQDQLGDIVFVDLPEVGDRFEKGDEFGTVESVKAVAELYMPLSGEIAGVNNALDGAPELVNKSPYEEGWMIEVKPDDPSEINALMTAEAYLRMLTGLE